jgi:hypothetical protein
VVAAKNEFMNESPSEELPPVLNTTDTSAPSLRYGRIWFFNALVTSLAISFFMVTDMGTSEFLDDFQGLIFLAIISLFSIGPAVGIGKAIFFVTKRILEKKSIKLNHVAAIAFFSSVVFCFVYVYL